MSPRSLPPSRAGRRTLKLRQRPRQQPGRQLERLRTYGGVVFASDNAVDGHAWTSYQRETDDEWVITDWCYWPKETPISERKPIAEEYNYIDDYFFIQASRTVETPYTNRVRYAAPTVGALLEAVA